MSKVVRRFRLNDYWDMAEHESWYTHMAQQGLFLKKKGAFFTYFEQRPSQKMKYRIEVSKKALEDAQIDFYESAGWEYVTHYNYFHVIQPLLVGEALFHCVLLVSQSSLQIVGIHTQVSRIVY